jgi:hypothetical protein
MVEQAEQNLGELPNSTNGNRIGLGEHYWQGIGKKRWKDCAR